MTQINRLFDIPYFQLEKFPQQNMFVTKKDHVWVPMSTSEFLDRTTTFAKALLKLGVQPGEKVALVSENRVEWNIMDIAIQRIGAIVTPLYPNISESDYKYILNDSEVRFVFVSNQELFDKISSIKSDVPSFDTMYMFETSTRGKHWEEITEDLDGVSEADVQQRMDAVKYEDLATIIYTSGTTGNPKGVMLSHRNILSNVKSCEPRIPADNNSKVLTFLPVCHIYERMLHYLYMRIGASIYFAESLETIGDNIREVQPDVFTAVPRLIEKVYDKIIAKGEDLTGVKRKLFFWAVDLANEYELTGKSAWYSFKLKIARKLIFSKWKEALGGNVRAIASGSAALQPRLARVFFAAGIPVLEGYGLTETSPVVSVNCLQNGVKFGSVGPLVDDVEVKIAEDGEILVKGPNVMMGYYKLPEVTKEAIDADGWFHTGDIGVFEEGKFLKITDRKKEIFKTSGGKYIVPQMMENKFKESRFIEQIMVIGEGEKFPSGFIVPSFAFVKEWAKRKNIDLGDGSNESIVANKSVVERIEREVETLNAHFGNWEKLKRTRLLPNEFSVEGGELTPTLKFKRKKILEKYKAVYDEIYNVD